MSQHHFYGVNSSSSLRRNISHRRKMTHPYQHYDVTYTSWLRGNIMAEGEIENAPHEANTLALDLREPDTEMWLLNPE
ncbi:hypothetical protein Tco_0397762 [Tanacetum coccineum]